MNKRASTSEEVEEPEWRELEREDCDNNDRDSEEVDSDSGEWESDSEGDSIGEAGMIEH